MGSEADLESPRLSSVTRVLGPRTEGQRKIGDPFPLESFLCEPRRSTGILPSWLSYSNKYTLIYALNFDLDQISMRNHPEFCGSRFCSPLVL